MLPENYFRRKTQDKSGSILEHKSRYFTKKKQQRRDQRQHSKILYARETEEHDM